MPRTKKEISKLEELENKFQTMELPKDLKDSLPELAIEYYKELRIKYPALSEDLAFDLVTNRIDLLLTRWSFDVTLITNQRLLPQR